MSRDSYRPDKDAGDRYVQRRMSRSETDAFEIWLLENPDALEDLKVRTALRDGIKAQGVVPESRSQNALPAWLGWLTNPRLASAFALVALAVMLGPSVFYVATLQENARLDQQAQALARPAVAVSALRLPVSRSIDDQRIDATITLTRQPTIFILDFDVSPWLDQSDQFSLGLGGVAPALQLDNLSVTEGSTVQVALNSATLSPGLLLIELREGKKVLSTYRIQVTPP